MCVKRTLSTVIGKAQWSMHVLCVDLLQIRSTIVVECRVAYVLQDAGETWQAAAAATDFLPALMGANCHVSRLAPRRTLRYQQSRDTGKHPERQCESVYVRCACDACARGLCRCRDSAWWAAGSGADRQRQRVLLDADLHRPGPAAEPNGAALLLGRAQLATC